MNYGALISEAFWLTWRNRFLWFFGFFASGGFSFNFNFPTIGPDGSRDGRRDASPEWTEDLARWIGENLVLFLVVVILLVVLIALVLIVLSMISQGGLVESVAALHQGETRRFATTWRAGITYFWRVLGLKVLFLLISLGLVIVIVAPLALAGWAIFSSTDSAGVIFLFIFFAVLLAITLIILVFVPVAIVGQLALRKLVLGGERVLGSIRAALELFWSNLGRSLLIWVILIGLTLAAWIALFIVGLILGLVIFVPVLALLTANLTVVAIVVGVVGALILLAPFVVITGAIGAFGASYWTLAYLRLTTPTREALLPPGQEE
jgi:hypothetical protein